MRQMRENEELRGIGMLHAAMNGGGGAQAAAQPAGELIHMAQAVATLHQGAANTALTVADMERKRRMESEQEAAGQADAAREDERAKASSTVEIVRQMSDMAQANIRGAYEMQASFQQQLQAAEARALSERLTAIDERARLQQAHADERYAALIEAERAEKAKLAQQLERMSQPRSVEQMKAELIAAQMASGNLDGVLTMLGVPRGESVDEYLQKGHAQRYLRGLDNDEARKQEDHAMRQRFIDESISLLQHIGPAIGASLGNPVGAPVRNGMGAQPPGFEPPEPDAGVVANQTPIHPPMGDGAANAGDPFVFESDGGL